MKKKIFILWGIGLVIFALFYGCYKGEPNETAPPFVQIYDVPPDSSIMGAAPIIWWWGTDVDGIIDKYQWLDIVADKINESDLSSYYNGELPIPDEIISEDETDTFQWVSTDSSADTIYLLLEAGDTMTKHLFCVRSIDIDNKISDAECRIYYRTNVPPDSMYFKENEDYAEGDTFWILNDTTYDWNGIRFDWSAHDPDNSVILEYFWWVENYDNPSEIARTSKADDSLFTVYSGDNIYDGWVRLNYTTLKGEIPTGHWRLIITVRDDAFQEGVADTFEFYAVHPDFDPSIDSIAQMMADTTYPHKMLVIFAAPIGWQDDMGVFYCNIFQNLMNDGVIDTFDTSRAVSSGEYMNLTKFDLADYSIIYLFNLSFMSTPTLAPGPDMLEELKEYVTAGGRVIFDGRQFFSQVSNSDSSTNPFGQIPFVMFGITTNSDMGNWNWSEALDQVDDIYPDLYIDSTKTLSGKLGGVRTVGLYPHFFGIPYGESIYRGGDYEGADNTTQQNIIGRHLGVRFAKPNTRTALFSFPLYYAQNDGGLVEQTLRETFRFIITSFPIEDEESEGLFGGF
ncbi:hypothetical protein J7L68_03360 [bacterium]|nr:hypothetical protein [bacterium]